MVVTAFLKSEVSADSVYQGCSVWTLMNFVCRLPGRQASSEFPLRAQGKIKNPTALLAGVGPTAMAANTSQLSKPGKIPLTF